MKALLHRHWLQEGCLLERRELGLELTENNANAIAEHMERPRFLDSLRGANTLGPSSALALSGKYQIPYFPLLGISPDTQDVPVLPLEASKTATISSCDAASELKLDRHGKCLTAFINLKGIRGLQQPS